MKKSILVLCTILFALLISTSFASANTNNNEGIIGLYWEGLNYNETQSLTYSTNLSIIQVKNEDGSPSSYTTVGERVEIISISDDKTYVRLSSNRYGYVSSKYIAKNIKSNYTYDLTSSTEEKKYVISTVAKKYYFPSTLSKVKIGKISFANYYSTISFGEEVTIIGETSTGFSIIKSNGKVSFIKTSYLSDTCVNMYQENKVAYVTKNCKASCSLTEEGKISLPKGMKVNVIATSDSNITMIEIQDEFYLIDSSFLSDKLDNSFIMDKLYNKTLFAMKSTYMYKTASTSSAKLGKLQKGSKIKVLGKSKNFYVLIYRNETVFIPRNALISDLNHKYIDKGSVTSSDWRTYLACEKTIPGYVMTDYIEQGWDIRFRSNLNIDKVSNFNQSICGLCCYMKNRIYLKTTYYGADSISHEIGHFIDSRNNYIRDTKKFKSIFKAEKSKATNKLKLRDYAMTNSAEYFACFYAYILNHPAKAKKYCPKTFSIISECQDNLF